MMMMFRDRAVAGRKLAEQLSYYNNKPDVVAIGLPRGGVVTAFEVARVLQVPLDLLIVRKIGLPENPELAVGALAHDGSIFFNEKLMKELGLTVKDLTRTIEQEKAEAARRYAHYKGKLAPIVLRDKTVLLIDDGIATGATMRVAIKSVKAQGVKKIVVAVPVAPPDTLEIIAREVDEIVCLLVAQHFWAVGAFYEQFPQVTDEEVLALMRKA